MEKSAVRKIVLAVFKSRQVKTNNTYYDPDIWLEIFSQVYGSVPIDYEDWRFDHLLFDQKGYRALRWVRLYERFIEE